MREPVEELFPGYSRSAYRVIKMAVGGVMKGLYNVTVEGLGNVPSSGAGVVAANHISFLDSFFIPLVIPRRVTYLAKAEYWESWKTRWFFNLVGQIPVHRKDTVKAQAALDAGLKVLERDGLLGIYPEGTRSPDGCLYRGRTGVARMSSHVGCPVVPVGLVGTREIMAKDAKLPRMRGDVTVRFGEPMVLTQNEIDDDPLAMRSFVDGLMYEIRRLSGQDYRDEYADKRPAKAPAPAAA